MIKKERKKNITIPRRKDPPLICVMRSAHDPQTNPISALQTT